MTKNSMPGQSMTPTEQKVYFALSGSGGMLFDIAQIRSYGLCGEGMLRRALSSLVAKGRMTRIKKGLYLIGDTDPFIAGPYMFNGYLAFSSALYVYRAFDERPSLIYVANASSSATRILEGMEIKGVALHRRALGMTRHEGYIVSTKAKTVYDSLYLPEDSGGYGRVLRGIAMLGMGRQDWDEFLSYVKRFEGPSFRRKAGYLFSVLNTAGAFVPRRVIDSLRCQGGVTRLGQGRKGSYVREWNLVDYVGKEVLMGWVQ